MLLYVQPLSLANLSSSVLPCFRFSITAPSPDRRLPKSCFHFLNSAGSGNRDGKWKLVDIDPGYVQQKASSWLLKAQTLLSSFTTPFVKPGLVKKLEINCDPTEIEPEMFLALEMTVDRRTRIGYISFAAAVSIEQFGRMVQNEWIDG